MPDAIGPAPTAIPYGREEDRLRRLAATIPGMLYDYVLNPDSSSKFLYVGPKCREILELNEQELLADAGLFWELVVAEDLQQLKSEDVAANREGESFSAEVRIRTRSGSLKWIQLSSRPNPAPPGELVVWSGFMLDITERKKAEKKMAFHSNILQNLSEGINIVRVSDGIVVFANRQFERMFGYGSGELEGKHISIVNAPDERSAEAVAKEITAELERTSAWAGEVKNIRKDGSVFWCQASITMLDHDEFGQVWVSVHEDITQRKQAELSLTSSKNRYQGILYNMMDAYWRVDEKGRIVEANEAICQMHDYSKEEILQMSISDFEVIESAEDTQKHIETIMREGRDTFESQHRCRDGRIIDVEISASLASDAPGNVDAFHRDITARKQAKAELIHHRDHLEELVFARTAELAAARDAAEAANRAKSVFLANMSHELRTPMNGIMGMTDLALRRATDPKQIDQLNKSKGAAQHLLSVINDVLDISKIESERLTLEEKNFSLAQVVEDTFQIQAESAQAKGLRLSCEIDPALDGLLCGDAMRLKQILINYTGNAIKFSESGKITVRARVC